MLSIAPAAAAVHYDHTRTLIRAFMDWQRQTYQDIMYIFQGYLDQVEQELDNLPGVYGPPGGMILLAYWDEEPVGVVAMHRETDELCHMKRMFVEPRFQGKGIGKALVEALLVRAREMGYSRMQLETGARQVAAQKLYQKLGFEADGRTFEVPEPVRRRLPKDLQENGQLFMERAL